MTLIEIILMTLAFLLAAEVAFYTSLVIRRWFMVFNPFKLMLFGAAMLALGAASAAYLIGNMTATALAALPVALIVAYIAWKGIRTRGRTEPAAPQSGPLGRDRIP